MSSTRHEDPENPPAAAKSRRSPGTGFPIVALPEAARIIQEAGKYGFEHSVSAFARYMGHSTTNSGAFRGRLAALRDWKLITGRGDTVAFTDTARAIALPHDAEAERDALQMAFMNCSVFASLYDRVSKGQSVDAQRLGAIAVHENGVSPSSVDRFTSSFVSSAIAAGLAREAGAGQIVLVDIENAEGLESARDSSEVNADDVAPALRAQGTARLHPVIHQEWVVGGGSVLLEVRLDRPLPAALFSAVGSVVKEAERLSDALGKIAPELADS